MRDCQKNKSNKTSQLKMDCCHPNEWFELIELLVVRAPVMRSQHHYLCMHPSDGQHLHCSASVLPHSLHFKDDRETTAARRGAQHTAKLLIIALILVPLVFLLAGAGAAYGSFWGLMPAIGEQNKNLIFVTTKDKRCRAGRCWGIAEIEICDRKELAWQQDLWAERTCPEGSPVPFHPKKMKLYEIL